MTTANVLRFGAPDVPRGAYVAIGNFDGVHRGHRAMCGLLASRARQARTAAVVLTFDPHPLALLRPGSVPPALTTTAHKAELLHAAGVDAVVVYPTDAALLAMTPDEFFAGIVCGALRARGLVEGPNFRYGRNRAGTIDTLRASCAAAGLAFDAVEAVEVGSRMVSSSAVRQDVAAGRLRDAVELLGHPYRLEGRVATGAARGRLLGFPTANLEGIATLVPPPGVYAGTTTIGGKTHPAAVSIGPNPSFDDERHKVEAHVVDFSGDLYGQALAIDLVAEIRPLVRFPDVAALREQLARDVAETRRLVPHGG